jgi:hypothetical protein
VSSHQKQELEPLSPPVPVCVSVVEKEEAVRMVAKEASHLHQQLQRHPIHFTVHCGELPSSDKQRSVVVERRRLRRLRRLRPLT